MFHNFKKGKEWAKTGQRQGKAWEKHEKYIVVIHE